MITIKVDRLQGGSFTQLLTQYDIHESPPAASLNPGTRTLFPLHPNSEHLRGDAPPTEDGVGTGVEASARSVDPNAMEARCPEYPSVGCRDARFSDLGNPLSGFRI